MSQSLPGIVYIAYIKANHLPSNIITRHLSGLSIAILNSVTKVCFFGEPSCESEDAVSDGVHIEKTSLQFNTSDNIPTLEDLAFVIKDVNGYAYVIGQKEGPFPDVEISKMTGVPSGEASQKTVKVLFKAKNSLIPCYL